MSADLAVIHFKVTHSAFYDARIQREVPANELIVTGALRAQDLVTRLKNCGAADAVATELTSTEYRQIVMARLPRLAAAAR
jgi:hypothetical protein